MLFVRTLNRIVPTQELAMQPTDEANTNVVQFGKPRLVENFVATEEESSPIVTDIDPEKAQMYLAIEAAAGLLVENRDSVESFVMAITIRDKDAPPDVPGRFTIATSPIKVADFCLTLKMLELSLTRNMSE